jgi:hypothetical protein
MPSIADIPVWMYPEGYAPWVDLSVRPRTGRPVAGSAVDRR